MFSASQSSQRLTSSPYAAPILNPRHVHSITASACDQPTLPTEPCCQSEVDHGTRQPNAVTSREAAAKVPTRLHQDTLIPALWPKYRPVDWKPTNFTSFSDSASLLSDFREEGPSDANVKFNTPVRQDVLSSHFKEPSGHPNPNMNSDLHPDLFSTPPSPLDLSALQDTWEHVRAYCDHMMPVKSTTHASIGKISLTEVLSPRNIRIQSDPNHRSGYYARAKTIWDKQQVDADDAIKKTDIQKRLEDDGIWVCEETATTAKHIGDRIDDLERNFPTVEAEWSVHFWQDFFFKHGNNSPSRLLQKCIERRQLHSESLCDANGVGETDPDDRLPPVVDPSRHSVPASAEPWIMTKFDRRGYAFSDILYAATTPEDLTSDDDIQRLPGMRLFRDTLHLPAGLTVEIKPLGSDKKTEKEKLEHAVRYSTLTASIMLHEELKLCHLASDDDDFFPEPEHLSNHFVAAVGHTAYHFIHSLRGRMPDDDDVKSTMSSNADDVKYESYLLKVYELDSPNERKAFRRAMNRIYVHQIQTIKDLELARLRKVLALDPETRKHRLETRAHKNIRFSHEKRGAEWGFKVHDDSPQDQKSEQSATHHDAVDATVPAQDVDKPPNNMDDLIEEKQVDVPAPDLSLPVANSKKRLAQDTDSAPGPRREKNAVMGGDGAMQGRGGGKKLCGSTNTKTGMPCRLPCNGASCRIPGHRVEA